MNTPKLLVALSSLAALAGCSFAARSPEMYARDTEAVLATKTDAIRACYDGVLKTAPTAGGTVAITFDVETHAGRIVNVAVSQGNTTAPAPVVSCVTQGLDGLALNPPDSRVGKASWTYHFTPPPPAAPPAAPPGPPGPPPKTS